MESIRSARGQSPAAVDLFLVIRDGSLVFDRVLPNVLLAEAHLVICAQRTRDLKLANLVSTLAPNVVLVNPEAVEDHRKF